MERPRQSSSLRSEGKNTDKNASINVSGINIEWKPLQGICTFEKLPVAMMWVDTTLAGLFSGMQAMVGTERYLLALQSEGRKSVEADWAVISTFVDFKDGFAAIANIAAVAGWGEWILVSIDNARRECCFRIKDSWEGRYQKALGVKWGSGMLAGKMAGYCTKLYNTNCWADQTAFIASGDPYDEFIVKPSGRLLEKEIENLLLTDEATRADMAVALKKLEKEITERKLAEESLRVREERYRALVETTGTGYVIIDKNGKVIDANQEYIRLSGHTELNEIIDRNVIEWTAESERQNNSLAIEKCLIDGFIRNYTVNYIDKSGRLTPIELNATLVGAGDSSRILTLCRDISERIHTEQMLQNAHKLESLGVLAGGIAHDFNNLLTGIFGYMDMARMSLSESSAERDNLDRAIAVFSRAKALTQQLLTFSKGSAPEKKRISIVSIVRETVHFALSGSNVKEQFDIQEGLWSCDADSHQIGQVIDNIVINARQAMPLGGSILLSVRNVDINEKVPQPLHPARYVKIAIQDNGIGISPEILPRIFDPFFTTKQQGSGLGLAMAYSIIKKHGGHIFAESKLGKGTLFTIYLPAVLQNSELKPVYTNKPLKKGEKRVLVMDDEEFIRQVATAFLKDMGCLTVTASNGQEAISIYEKALREAKPFDLVILDLTIPGAMGGRQAMEELRRINPDIKVIASSGHSDDPVMADPVKFGFRDKLNKPYLQAEFHHIVGSILE